ncbi:MAG: hypothetical protein JO263_05200 [Candidatus Eremiobacteraeota bacterium]|nr:hypothetical protein [Candidatus Eremiobacteraeota bacterium]
MRFVYRLAVTLTTALLASCGSSGSSLTSLTPPSHATQLHRSIYYVVQNLGSFGGTGCCLVVTNNDRGWVDGTSNLPGDKNFHPFVWRGHGLKDLGTLGGPNASVGGMNDRGDVTVGGADTGKPDPLGEDFCGFGTHQICLSFIWRNGKRTLIPTLGGNNNDVNTVNNRGLVLAVAETAVHATCRSPQVLKYQGFTWELETHKIHRLLPLKGDEISEAFNMNERGDAVGYSGICGAGEGDIYAQNHAALWRDGKPIDLGSLGGTIANAATGINDRDQISGTSALHGDTTAHAFMWERGAMKDLGTLPGDHLSFAGNINAAGDVPMQSCKSVAVPKCRAALWQDGVITDLNTLVHQRSSLFLIGASWVNDHGDIVGTALDRATGAQVPFLATRCDPDAALPDACTQAAHDLQIIGTRRDMTLPETSDRRIRALRLSALERSAL